ncbi:MAG: FHA domain-containing protein [Candidatus Cloacimonetes bacterium]|jgi:hypothetical protein|nr:FHA domain-containing protein [Candidatus Cloacimonadota bacterium]
MKLKCNQCGKQIQALDNFCNYCGAEAPRVTVMAEKPAIIKNPQYCVNCGKENVSDALYCADCGKFNYKLPDNPVFYCGNCGTKNSKAAKICVKCSLKFADWFGMKGAIAEQLGYQGNLVLFEKMTGISYHFISDNIVKLGRSNANTIKIPCSWISNNHCHFDLKKSKLVDTSTNGTFINRKSDKIKQELLEFISEFNLAGSFTFPLVKLQNLFIFHLGAIIDEKECRRNGDGVVFDELRKQYYILYNGDFQFKIRKMDGNISEDVKPHLEYYEFNFIDGFYYYSDGSKNIKNQLIMKHNANLPLNWVLK